MASSEPPPSAAAGDDRSGERLTVRQARVLEVLAGAGAPVSGEAIAAQVGVRAGALSVTLRSLQRRGLIAAAPRRARALRRLAAAPLTVTRGRGRARGAGRACSAAAGVETVLSAPAYGARRPVPSVLRFGGSSMNKSELVEQVAGRAGLSHGQAAGAVS